MEYIDIKTTEHTLFTQAWNLYKKSFPQEERRQLRTQKKIMRDVRYHFELITDKDLFVGFMLWWELEDMSYVEHLATFPHLRGKGYGLRILKRFISKSNSPICLEVEHPTNEISRRRIGFYQRIGFVLNEHAYKHPPYKKGGEYVPLMLMTYPDAITEKEVKRFCENYHPTIHKFVLNSKL